MAELRSRYVNSQVTELIARLGIHAWRLADEEKYFLHRYIYLSVAHGLKTLGIEVSEQDPPFPTNGIIPHQVPDLLRVPTIPEPVEDATEALLIQVRETNGRHD
jgi:hypothetical protein